MLVLLTEKESKKAIDKFSKKDVSELLRNMYASSNREKYITRRIKNIITPIVEKRAKITLPTNEEIIANMGEVIDEITS